MRSVADLLWGSMVMDPKFALASTGPTRLWTTRVYPWLMRRQLQRTASHKNPEPLLTVTCALRSAAGHDYLRAERRFEGIIGGRLTESEYQRLSHNHVRTPLIIVGGFPRTGTTSLQSLIRHSWPEHIAEIESEFSRFSLWSYPKHDLKVMTALASLPPEQVIVLQSVRRFEDSVASLALARGSLDQVDIGLKLIRWRQWAELSLSGQVISIPYEHLATQSPEQMIREISRRLGLAPSRDLPESFSFQQLLSSQRQGGIPDSPQSNLPKPSYRNTLQGIIQDIREQLSFTELQELTDMYEQIASQGVSLNRI